MSRRSPCLPEVSQHLGERRFEALGGGRREQVRELLLRAIEELLGTFAPGWRVRSDRPRSAMLRAVASRSPAARCSRIASPAVTLGDVVTAQGIRRVEGQPMDHGTVGVIGGHGQGLVEIRQGLCVGGERRRTVCCAHERETRLPGERIGLVALGSVRLGSQVVLRERTGELLAADDFRSTALPPDVASFGRAAPACCRPPRG